MLQTSPSVEFLADDIEKFHKELKSKNVRFVKELHDEPWGGKQATFTDPDGNILEMCKSIGKNALAYPPKEGARKKREPL